MVLWEIFWLKTFLNKKSVIFWQSDLHHIYFQVQVSLSEAPHNDNNSTTTSSQIPHISNLLLHRVNKFAPCFYWKLAHSFTAVNSLHTSLLIRSLLVKELGEERAHWFSAFRRPSIAATSRRPIQAKHGTSATSGSWLIIRTILPYSLSLTIP